MKDHLSSSNIIMIRDTYVQKSLAYLLSYAYERDRSHDRQHCVSTSFHVSIAHKSRSVVLSSGAGTDTAFNGVSSDELDSRGLPHTLRLRVICFRLNPTLSLTITVPK